MYVRKLYLKNEDKMKTINHPAFIRDYNVTYTNVLKTLPVGTYALMSPNDEDEPSSFLIIINKGDRVIGLPYMEYDEEGDIQINTYRTMALYKQKIDSIVGNGIDEHFEVNDGNTNIQLTSTLNEQLKQQPSLASKLKTNKQIEQEKPVLSLSLKIQKTIEAINADIKSGKHRCEANDFMSAAISLLKEKGAQDENYDQIIRGLFRIVSKIETYSGFDDDISFAKMKELIEQIGKDDVSNNRINKCLTNLRVVAEEYDVRFKKPAESDPTDIQMLNFAFGQGSNLAKNLNAMFAHSPQSQQKPEVVNGTTHVHKMR